MRAYNKYSAKKTEVDGILFASKLEAKCYRELKTMQALNFIKGLELQKVFSFIYNDKKIFKYIADFYFIGPDGPTVRDAKGVATPLFNLKFKLMKAAYPEILWEIWPKKKRK